MLTQLSIRNYTLIDHLELELDQGMTVISGETGAGKSIMLDALGLALGDRADSDMVRTDCERADITACFDVASIPEAHDWLKAHQLDNNNDCLMRRVVSRNGRSKAYINGHPTPLQNLRDLGERLIDIHGQHEHQRLLRKESHVLLLDAVGQLQKPAATVDSHFNEWTRHKKQLAQIRQQSSEQRAEVQLLTYQVQELDLLAPLPNELTELENEQSLLSSAEELIQSGELVRQLTTESEDTNCSALLNQCLHQLGRFTIDSAELSNATEMLNSALIQVEEASSSLEAYLSRLEANPTRLTQVEDRLSSFYQVARKHHCDPDALPTLHAELSSKLSAMTLSDESLEALEVSTRLAEQTFTKAATELSSKRHQAADELTRQINEQLRSLGMPNCQFKVGMTERTPSRHGLEDIEFLICTNPGQPPRALHKVASGGELSRISLAIQVVTAKVSATPVLAFDEVDVGIGGAIAEVVGRLLRDLGTHSQVLCVTHQPQVASQGHHHLYVSKHSGDDCSHSSIHRLDQQQRIREIARMLGGIDITQRSLDHAEEMLNLN